MKLESMAYAAKAAARFAKAKGAHDELIAAAHRAQADALEIEAAAKRRLADEYDAAQERGEVAGGGFKGNQWSVPEGNAPATVADLGLTRKQVHEARQLRDAEAADPGVIRRTLDARLDRGQEPTKAAVRQSTAGVVCVNDNGPAAAKRLPGSCTDARFHPRPLRPRRGSSHGIDRSHARHGDQLTRHRVAAGPGVAPHRNR